MAVACPAWARMRGDDAVGVLANAMNRKHDSDEGVSKEDVAALREEVARLKAERAVSGSKDEYV